MVPSPLQLTICFPSGLHATEKTLRLSEVNKRIQRSREGKNWKKTYKFECPVSGHSQTYIFTSFKLLSFSIIYLSNKSTSSSGRSHQHSQQEQDFPRYFPSMLRRKNLTPLSARGSTPQTSPWNCKKSGHESTEPWREKLEDKKLRKKNVRAQVPGQRRLAISRLRVPDLDALIMTAAGNFLSIGAPRHWVDPEITRSHHTNQQKQREKNREKLTRPSARSPSTGKPCRCQRSQHTNQSK